VPGKDFRNAAVQCEQAATVVEFPGAAKKKQNKAESGEEKLEHSR